jgi:hypothetical protein
VQLGQNEGHLQAVFDERVPRFPLLPGVRPVAEFVRPPHQRNVDVGIERFDFYDEFGQILRISFGSLRGGKTGGRTISIYHPPRRVSTLGGSFWLENGSF